MESTLPLRRIGIVGHSGWASAPTYSRMILHSLGAACSAEGIETYLLLGQNQTIESPDGLSVRSIELSTSELLPGERILRSLLRLKEKSEPIRGEMRIRRTLRLVDRSNPFDCAERNGIQALIPMLDVPDVKVGVKTIGWIPDFQHVHLPEFFSKAERERRVASSRRVARNATLIMLSSNTSLSHFREFIPEHFSKARVASFPSLFAFESRGDDPVPTRALYDLPEKFALVANQFWAHKNHLLVLRAIGKLKSGGLRIPVVMTGLPIDSRDPANKVISEVLQEIAIQKVSDLVTVLGQVPYSHLKDLMRLTALVVQPSRFEGWSTVVQDAKAIGRPILCSNIPIHLEQAPAALGHFSCDRVDELAAMLAEHWSGLEAGPDFDLETKAIADEKAFAARYGQLLLDMCKEAVSIPAR